MDSTDAKTVALVDKLIATTRAGTAHWSPRGTDTLELVRELTDARERPLRIQVSDRGGDAFLTVDTDERRLVEHTSAAVSRLYGVARACADDTAVLLDQVLAELA